MGEAIITRRGGGNIFNLLKSMSGFQVAYADYTNGGSLGGALCYIKSNGNESNGIAAYGWRATGGGNNQYYTMFYIDWTNQVVDLITSNILTAPLTYQFGSYPSYNYVQIKVSQYAWEGEYQTPGGVYLYPN